MVGVHRDEEMVSLFTKTVLVKTNALYRAPSAILPPNDYPIPLGVMLYTHK